MISFLGIFGTWMVLAGTCHARNLEDSDLSSLPIVYTLYPYYNSETLLGVLKAEQQEPPRVAGNAETALGRESEGQKIARGDRNDATENGGSAHQDSSERRILRNDSSGSAAPRSQQRAEITYWPPVQTGAVPQINLGRADNVVRQSNI